MKKFLNTIKHTIETHALIKAGDTILAGVSGGADSVALLEVLDDLRKKQGLTIIVGHVNHRLRKSADTDQRFVERLCQKKNIPCHCVRVRISKATADSLEQTARNKRFDALRRLAKKHRADAIALAHHQDDLAETVLMRILRGSGLQGLQAILPKRTIGEMLFIRPLLDVTHSDIEAFLKNKKIPFRTDPTNRDPRFLRNNIRHQLLPLLQKDYNPRIAPLLAGLAETVAMDYDLLSASGQYAFHNVTTRVTGRQIGLSIPKLKRLHPALIRLVIRQAVTELKGDTRRLTRRHIQNIEQLLTAAKPNGTEVHLPMGITVKKSKLIIISMS